MTIATFGLAGIASLFLGGLLLAVLLAAAVVSFKEWEPLAGKRLIAFAVVLPLPFLIAGWLAPQYGQLPALVLLVLSGLVGVFLLVPWGRGKRQYAAIPKSRIDERDIMFSRAELKPGTERFVEYYRLRPENRDADDLFRSKPGLSAKGSTAYDPFQFSATDASFWSIERLRPFVDGSIADKGELPDSAEISQFLKMWAVKLGAVSAGITKLEEYHKYSIVGRGTEYGRPVDLSHQYALALTVEMDKRAVDSAPLGPAAMETAQQYVAAGTIAVQVAAFIRRLGYPARAHIDGNYRVVCPLVARDAGLGEIGRMGLLMTPNLGPRVRIAVVTTDIPLVPDTPGYDYTAIDFCERCTKCAEVCPSGAISKLPRSEVEGVERWQIDSEACFTLWCQLGTDCARCVKACPYSHPDNLLHNLVRRGVRYSSLIRELAVRMDDVLYGKNPNPVPPLDWQTVKTMKD